MAEEQKAIIFFDGVCNLCNSSVQFIIENDKEDAFRFAALQSIIAQDILSKYNISSKEQTSVVLLENEKIYFRSEAALRIAKKLHGWKLVYGFIIIPKFIRDGIYNLIAKSRYKVWGKQESCWVPTPALKNKFL